MRSERDEPSAFTIVFPLALMIYSMAVLILAYDASEDPPLWFIALTFPFGLLCIPWVLDAMRFWRSTMMAHEGRPKARDLGFGFWKALFKYAVERRTGNSRRLKLFYVIAWMSLYISFLAYIVRLCAL